MNIDEIKKLPVVRKELELTDQCYRGGYPVKVDVHFDERTNTAYQVDKQIERYRMASSPGPYGDWKLTKRMPSI